MVMAQVSGWRVKVDPQTNNVTDCKTFVVVDFILKHNYCI